MKKEGGQSLIEVLVAMGVFALWICSVAFLVLDVFVSDKVAREKTIAVFSAREGVEAVRSIRDNDWGDLSSGEHGLAVAGGHWALQGSQEDISDLLRGGVRKIIVEDIDSDRKKVTSEISWKFTEERPQQIKLFTYFTNWSKITEPETCADYCQLLGYSTGVCRAGGFWCSIYGEEYEPGGNDLCPRIWNQDSCCCD